MNKKIIYLLIIFLLQGCGYVPTYSKINQNNQKINIQIIDSKGDNTINEIIKFKLSKYKNIDAEKKYLIKINSNYDKIILSRDKTGSIDQYQLKSTVSFEVKFNDLTKVITIEEESNLKTNTDKFKESIYENEVKQNFGSTIVNKLLLELTLLL